MNRTLSSWLSYLETLHPQAINLGLERVKQIAQKLALTKFSIPVIMVAGTNGKGSCVALLEAILNAAGYKVGVYTSPHLIYFNERIRIKNQAVSDKSLCEAFGVIEAEREGVAFTFFEFTTLAALYLLQQANLDVVILEVGLGGRLDAVNIVDADVAVISSISYDHMDFLGHDLQSIAKEKAGIIKAGSQVVNGDIAQAQIIQQIADSKCASLWQIGRDFSYQINGSDWEWRSKLKSLNNLPFPQFFEHNAALVLMVIQILQNRLPCKLTHIINGLSCAQLAGRFQVINCPQHCVLDVAHNPASAQLLAHNLSRNPIQGNNLAVVSILGDKDIAGTLKPLMPIIKKWYIGSLDVPRGLQAQQIAEELQGLGVDHHQNFVSVDQAFKAALTDYQANDRIVVYGSFYTVASALKLLQYNTD